jgi:hypothetical protein
VGIFHQDIEAQHSSQVYNIFNYSIWFIDFTDLFFEQYHARYKAPHYPLKTILYLKPISIFDFSTHAHQESMESQSTPTTMRFECLESVEILSVPEVGFAATD